MVSCENSLAIQVGVVCILQNYRVNVAVLFLEIHNAHTCVSDIEVCAEERIGNIQHTAEKGHTEALMCEQGNALVVRLDHLKACVFTIVSVTEREKEFIHFLIDAFRTLCKGFGKAWVCIPQIAHILHFF